MNDTVDNIIKNLQSWGSTLGFGEKKESPSAFNGGIQSPLPNRKVMDKGFENYKKQDMDKQALAKKNALSNNSSYVPTKLKYPDWIANAVSTKSVKKSDPIEAMTKPQEYKQVYGGGMAGSMVPIQDYSRMVTTTQNNRIPLKNPQVLSQQTAQQATPTPTPTPVPGVRVAPNIESFIVEKVLPITRKYGIPDAVAAGQFAQEGRFDGIGASKNNFFNIAFTDTKAESQNWNAVPEYKTPEEGIEAYARFLTGQAPVGMYSNGYDGSKWGKIGQKQLLEIAEQYKDDPAGWLNAIGPMYSSQGHQYGKNVMSTPEYRRFAYK